MARTILLRPINEAVRDEVLSLTPASSRKHGACGRHERKAAGCVKESATDDVYLLRVFRYLYVCVMEEVCV